MAPSIWQLLIVLLIVVMIFGTKKLKNIGSDLGGAVKGFKEGMREGSSDSSEQIAHKADADTIDQSELKSMLKPLRRLSTKALEALCMSRGTICPSVINSRGTCLSWQIDRILPIVWVSSVFVTITETILNLLNCSKTRSMSIFFIVALTAR